MNPTRSSFRDMSGFTVIRSSAFVPYFNYPTNHSTLPMKKRKELSDMVQSFVYMEVFCGFTVDTPFP